MPSSLSNKKTVDMDLTYARDEVSFFKEIGRIETTLKANVATDQLARAMQELYLLRSQE